MKTSASVILGLLLGAVAASMSIHAVAIDYYYVEIPASEDGSGIQSGAAILAGDPKADMEDLVSVWIGRADEMIRAHGAFLPYGGAIKQNGEIVVIAVGHAQRDISPAKQIKRLKPYLRERAHSGEFKATALVYDARVALPGAEEKSDVIALFLDHQVGYSKVFLVPYSLGPDGPIYGTAVSRKGAGAVFGSN